MAYDITIKYYKTNTDDFTITNVQEDAAYETAATALDILMDACTKRGEEVIAAIHVRRTRQTSYEIWASTENGETKRFSVDTIEAAINLADKLQNEEDVRRIGAKNKTLRSMPEAFDCFYVKRVVGRKGYLVHRAAPAKYDARAST